MVGRIEIELDDGSGEPAGRPDQGRSRSKRGPTVVLLVAVAAAAVAVWASSPGGGRSAVTTVVPAPAPVTTRAAPAPTTTGTRSPDTTGVSGSTTPGATVGRLAATFTPLPPSHDHLLVYGVAGELADVDPARGTASSLPMPGLDSTGPVRFVAGAGWTVIRPIDLVRGYLLDEVNHAVPLDGGLAGGVSDVFAGPAPRSAWVVSGPHDDVLLVAGLDGTTVRAPITVTSGGRVLGTDGAGELVADGPSGAYVTAPDGWHRLTDGHLLAIGATTALAFECDSTFVCTDVVIDRASSMRRRLLSTIAGTARLGVLGTVSPDGRFAALPAGNGSRIDVLDLVNGSVQVSVAPSGGGSDVRPVWSADSRLLYVVGADTVLRYVDMADKSQGELLAGVAWFGVRGTSTGSGTGS